MDANRVQLIGRLVRDPELRYTPTNGTPLCTFTLVNSFKDRPEYFNCEAWRKVGESIAQYVEQGQMLYLEGHLTTQSWDGECGKKHYATKVVVERCSFGPKKSKAPNDDEPAVFQEQAVDDDDDVPF
jgi:single-strand DNA-binding protein